MKFFKREQAPITAVVLNPGATFGPWADHDRGCHCNVCR